MDRGAFVLGLAPSRKCRAGKAQPQFIFASARIYLLARPSSFKLQLASRRSDSRFFGLLPFGRRRTAVPLLTVSARSSRNISPSFAHHGPTHSLDQALQHIPATFYSLVK